MMNRIACTIIIALCAVTGWAQEQKCDSVPDGIFYRISRGNMARPSYILGTLHTIPGDFVHYIPGFDQAAAEVEQFVFECDLHEKMRQSASVIDTTAFMFSDSILFRYENPDSLHNPYIEDMPSGIYGSIRKILAEEFDFTDFYRNSALENEKILLRKYQDNVTRMAADLGKSLKCINSPIDVYIADSIARKRGASIAELDTASVLINIDSTLNQFVEDEKNGKHDRKYYTVTYFPNIVVNLYFLQETTRLYCEQYFRYEAHAITGTPMKEDMEQKIFVERNRKWMQRLPQIIQDKSSMVVVGLSHLHDRPTTPGLLSSLIRLGYKVEAIASPSTGN